jgi:hypothetical protein
MAKALSPNPALFEDGELADAPPPLARRAFDLYNDFAKRNGWAVAQLLDPGRVSALKKAMPYYGGVAGFQANLEKASRSEFLMGRVPGRNGQKAFKLDLDFLLQPKTMRRVIEGFYNGEQAATPTVTTSLSRAMAPTDRWSLFLRDYKGRQSMWPGDLGPRPEEPGCRAPAAMLEVCRKRLGLTVAAPLPERSRTERMAELIVSYRNHGKYEDANRIERQLAAIEGRPAVEVPAPDARDPDSLPGAGPINTATNGAGGRDSAARAKTRPPWDRPRADVVSERINRRSEEPPPWDVTDIPEAEVEIVERGED